MGMGLFYTYLVLIVVLISAPFVIVGALYKSKRFPKWSKENTAKRIQQYRQNAPKREQQHKEDVSKRAQQQQAWIAEIRADGDRPLSCPQCGSTQLNSGKKGYDAGSGCCGALLVGPLGLLCGAAESSKVMVTCLKCGYSWEAGKQ